jgi:hypothetical protein
MRSVPGGELLQRRQRVGHGVRAQLVLAGGRLGLHPGAGRLPSAQHHAAPRGVQRGMVLLGRRVGLRGGTGRDVRKYDGHRDYQLRGRIV